jgi:antitoxin ParD1/3/4
MAERLTTMNISLPRVLRTFVRDRVNGGGFANASEYVRHLIRKEKGSEAVLLDQLLHEAVESGPAKPLTKRDWDGIRKRGSERAKQLKSLRRRSA